MFVHFETLLKTKFSDEMRRHFMRKFPGQPVPCHDTIRKLVKKLTETGSLLDKKPNIV